MSHQTIGNLAADTRINIEESLNAIVENVEAVLFILPQTQVAELWKVRVEQEFAIVRDALESIMTNVRVMDQYFMDFLNFEDPSVARDLTQLSVQINTELRQELTRLTYLVDALSVLPEEESTLPLVITNASNKILMAEERFNQALSDMSNLVTEFFKLTQPDGIDQE
ncbi:hypothetical protein KA183_04040 [bacterium]|nr:hypothetical protein [bacterium]QQR59987.1 MAG: hypothetical protein IPG59_11045 [Candidatus Melainabacteria bacterium]